LSQRNGRANLPPGRSKMREDCVKRRDEKQKKNENDYKRCSHHTVWSKRGKAMGKDSAYSGLGDSWK